MDTLDDPLLDSPTAKPKEQSARMLLSEREDDVPRLLPIVRAQSGI